jgi:hypothetical protein
MTSGKGVANLLIFLGERMERREMLTGAVAGLFGASILKANEDKPIETKTIEELCTDWYLKKIDIFQLEDGINQILSAQFNHPNTVTELDIRKLILEGKLDSRQIRRITSVRLIVDTYEPSDNKAIDVGADYYSQKSFDIPFGATLPPSFYSKSTKTSTPVTKMVRGVTDLTSAVLEEVYSDREDRLSFLTKPFSVTPPIVYFSTNGMFIDFYVYCHVVKLDT